jgi:hypothetical protein
MDAVESDRLKPWKVLKELHDLVDEACTLTYRGLSKLQRLQCCAMLAEIDQEVAAVRF